MPKFQPYGRELVYSILTNSATKAHVAKVLEFVLTDDMIELINRQDQQWLLGCLNACQWNLDNLRHFWGMSLDKAAEMTVDLDPNNPDAKLAHVYVVNRAFLYYCALALVRSGYVTIGDSKEN